MKPEKKIEIESASPPNPAKEKDRRYKAYVKKYGTTKCWELDALSPTYLVELVTKHVEALIEEPALWQERLDKITEERVKLTELAQEWAA